MKAGKADPMETFPQGTTRDTVAAKLGIGSGKQYEKEKFISDNCSALTPEDFADWDEGKLSTNKAYQIIKKKMETQSQDNKHNSWQKKIVVHKVPFKKEDDKNNIYGTINREAMYKSLELLNFVEFKVYMFIATNKDGYDFKLSTKYISNKIRTDQRNVQRAMNGLLEKGFLIKNENGGFDFYEDKNLAINDADGQNKATISVSESDTNCTDNVHYDRKSRHSNHPNNQLNNQLNNHPNNLGADAAGAAKERTVLV